MYEFTVVPSSLFAPDGTFYKTSDRADFAAEVNFIIVEMAFANAVDIQKFQIKNCSDFAKCFLNFIEAETKGYNEARIIFDRYD